jgi:hypothetical protein
MRNSVSLSERELETIEREKDPEIVPHLVSAIRQQQHELEALRLSMEVARRDREELRVALLSARAELDRRGTDSTVAGEPASEER